MHDQKKTIEVDGYLYYAYEPGPANYSDGRPRGVLLTDEVVVVRHNGEVYRAPAGSITWRNPKALSPNEVIGWRYHGIAVVRNTDVPIERPKQEPTDAYGHYFKDVSKLQRIDVYRVLSLFGVTDPCVQHAVKKLLVAGGRGAKDMRKDLTEARDSLNRALQMLDENAQ